MNTLKEGDGTTEGEKMKRTVVMIMSLILTIVMLSACGGSGGTGKAADSKPESTADSVKEENKAKSNEIINEQQAEKKTKRNKFIINKADYQKSGYQTKIISHRSSNCKNKILRNLIQDILIDWLSITNNKRRILRLKKLSKNNLEVIYKNYMNIKDFRLKEIYSGEYLKETSEKDRHIFEFNKKLIETSENMEAKLNCSFKQAFNYFNNKESIISSQNSNILSGLKSKNEYINEKKDKEFLEKNIQKLFEEINHEKAQSKDLY
jgi:predicted small secreted protein